MKANNLLTAFSLAIISYVRMCFSLYSKCVKTTAAEMRHEKKRECVY